MWSYHLISINGTPQAFESLDLLMRYCDRHRGQYAQYTVSIPHSDYKRFERLPDLDDPIVRLGYHLDV